MSTPDYKSWIERETRIRLRILRDFPEVKLESKYRVCVDCGEVCLCHEEDCPNCGSLRIKKQFIENLSAQTPTRFRCLHRFKMLNKSKHTPDSGENQS